MGFKDWETPGDFYDRLNEQFKFTYDAAASHTNTCCDTYSTLEGTFHTSQQGPIKESSEDGLTHSWAGERVFCNPPYDKTILQWLQKAPESSSAVFLLPPSVDTHWFNFISSDPSYSLIFLKGRLKFWRNGKPGPAPRAGNLVVIYHSWLP